MVRQCISGDTEGMQEHEIGEATADILPKRAGLLMKEMKEETTQKLRATKPGSEDTSRKKNVHCPQWN